MCERERERDTFAFRGWSDHDDGVAVAWRRCGRWQWRRPATDFPSLQCLSRIGGFARVLCGSACARQTLVCVLGDSPFLYYATWEGPTAMNGWRPRSGRVGEVGISFSIPWRSQLTKGSILVDLFFSFFSCLAKYFHFTLSAQQIPWNYSFLERELLIVLQKFRKKYMFSLHVWHACL